MTTTPLCLTCRYDLSATPGGRCPECGSEFTHAAIQASLHPTANLTPLMSAVVVAYLMVLIASLIGLAVNPIVGIACLAGSFLLAALLGWLALRRRVVIGFGALLGASALITMIPCLAPDRPVPEWLCVITLQSLALGAISGWFGTPGSPGGAAAAARRTAAWGGGVSLAGGCAVLLLGGRLWWRGYRWTELDSLITRGAAPAWLVATLGVGMVALGVILLGLWAMLARRATLKTSPSPPPSSSPCPPGSAPPSRPPPGGP